VTVVIEVSALIKLSMSSVRANLENAVESHIGFGTLLGCKCEKVIVIIIVIVWLCSGNVGRIIMNVVLDVIRHIHNTELGNMLRMSTLKTHPLLWIYRIIVCLSILIDL
jgi:hypothetical protein